MIPKSENEYFLKILEAQSWTKKVFFAHFFNQYLQNVRNISSNIRNAESFMNFPFKGLHTLREKCPDTEFFLVHIFPQSNKIRRDTKYLSVFSPNAGKYGPEKTPYLDTLHIVTVTHNLCFFEI